MTLQRVVRPLRARASQAATLVWSRSGVDAALFDLLSRRDCSPDALARAADPALRTENLVLEDHSIATEMQAATQAYLDYLRKPRGRVEQRRYGLTRLTGARLSYPAGVAMGAEGIVIDAYPNRSALKSPKYALAQALLPHRRTTTAHPAGVLLYAAWSHNFFHWVSDMLPKLSQLGPEEADLPLVVFDGAPKFVFESLAALVPDRPLLRLGVGVHAFDLLVVPSVIASPALVSGTGLAFLRQVYQPRLLGQARPSPASGARLYISRRDAGSRRIRNEAAIEAALAGLGFRSVTLSDHSLAAQAALFADAGFIVGSHGAAFTNLAFSPAGAKVIEIFRHGHRSRSFYSMAERLKLEYGFLLGAPAGTDIVIDPDLLVRLIRRMEAGEG